MIRIENHNYKISFQNFGALFGQRRMPLVEEVQEHAHEGSFQHGNDCKISEPKRSMHERAESRKENDDDNEGHDDQKQGVGAASKHLTEEEMSAQEEQLAVARILKAEGNQLFGEHDFEGAVAKYSEAIDMAPAGHNERAIFFNNRATCYFKLGHYDKVIEDCSSALKLDPDYAKCLLRRAQAYESDQKVCEAFDDFQRVVKLDSSNSIASAACKRLEKPAAAEREKQKEEMIGKLKDLGNTVLGKFGMSLDHFKATQDPNTGSYSISYNPGS